MMCMGDTDFTDSGFKPGPNYCPQHPAFDMGHLSGGGYQRQCNYCIRDAIKSIPDWDWLVRDAKKIGITIDRDTIQIVLDVLEQKFGLM